MTVNQSEFDEEHEFRQWLSKYDPTDQKPDDLIHRFITGINILGVDVYRSSLWLPTSHPELWGTQIVWTIEHGSQVFRRDHEISSTPIYLNTPGEAVHKERKALRWRLDNNEDLPYSLLEDVKNEGGTDYLIVPFYTDNAREQPWITFATKRIGGFSTLEIKTVKEFCTQLSWKARVMIAEMASKSLLSVYLGENAAQRVINGEFKRGTGEKKNAIIWFCDLREFTKYGDTHSPEDIVKILDQYFETIAGPIEDAGGEILKFIGDAILAIFPLTEPLTDACENVLNAAEQALKDLKAWSHQTSDQTSDQARPNLETGIALHIGNVLYGNVGGRSRLDFTVIGSAVNEASRLESLCKDTYPLLVTKEFQQHISEGILTSVGKKQFVGIDKLHEIFTLTSLVQNPTKKV
jgi:adenylate cyclase